MQHIFPQKMGKTYIYINKRNPNRVIKHKQNKHIAVNTIFILMPICPYKLEIIFQW
jgi:hypothetical protein